MADLSDDLFGNLPRKAIETHEIGINLDRLSIEDLEERIQTMLTEIERLKLAREVKMASKSAADQFFKA